MELTLNRAEVYALEGVTAKVAQAAQALAEAKKLKELMVNEVIESQGVAPADYRATNLDSNTRILTLQRVAPMPSPIPLAEAVSP